MGQKLVIVRYETDSDTDYRGPLPARVVDQRALPVAERDWSDSPHASYASPSRRVSFPAFLAGLIAMMVLGIAGIGAVAGKPTMAATTATVQPKETCRQ